MTLPKNSYHLKTQQAKTSKVPSSKERFVPISERRDEDITPSSIWKQIKADTYGKQCWKDVIIGKDLFQLFIYPTLLYEVRPKTIIEMGAFNGGSGLWMADHLEMFGIEGTFYAVDIDLSNLHEKVRNDDRMKFIKGDLNHLEDAFSPELLKSLPHPWLVIDDAHVNVKAVLDFFHHNGLQSGDYMIIEDTNPKMWEAFEGGSWDNSEADRNELRVGKQKLNVLKTWLAEHPDQYLIDTRYLDLYGYNASGNWNSVMRKI